MIALMLLLAAFNAALCLLLAYIQRRDLEAMRREMDALAELLNA